MEFKEGETKMATDTARCRDCDEELEQIKFVTPATPEEGRRLTQGLYIERKPLCYRCWVKRTHPA